MTEFEGKCHHRSIHKIVISNMIDIHQSEYKWYRASETSSGVYRNKMNSALKNLSPYFSWYGTRTSIHEFLSFSYNIYSIE